MPWDDNLDAFEKQLAEDREKKASEEKHHKRRSHRNRDEKRRNGHHDHHHRSHRDRDGRQDEHRSKRRRRDSHDSDDHHRSRHRHSRRRSSVAEENVDGGSVHVEPDKRNLKRDAWMEAPDAIDVDYVQRKRREPSPPKQGSLGQDFEMKLHKNELNHHLRDLQNDEALDELANEEAQHDVDYTFGDNGSSWRMTRLKAVYREAEAQGRKIEDVAVERYGSLREFDDAREEEIELDRRDRLGKEYVGKEKSSGDLFQERKLESGVKQPHRGIEVTAASDDEFDSILDNVSAPAPVTAQAKLDQTQVNKLKAQLMKAELKKDPNVEKIRQEYEAAVAATSSTDPSVVQLSTMDSRMLSSAPRNEAKSVTDRRGRERGNVEENEDMTIEDMIAEERRTKTQAGGEAQRFAERIAKDAKFDNDLEYMDENATKLAKRVHKSDINLRNVAINEYQKVSRILENCPLCYHEDNPSQPEPVAPVVSLATRAYLTLPTKPELAPYSAMIVPIQHHSNLLECDDDEWEEIRNFMKSLTRFYHSRDSDVIFYENAAFPGRRPHAALVAVPLPQSVGETSPAFFKEAFLSTESEWSQHKKIIDTLAKSKSGFGRSAFRKTLVKEMPYFHVWFEMDGGLAHVVEDPDKWPKGDLFAREIIGGMLGLETETIKKQGKWHRGADKDRIESFRKRWRKFDWTRLANTLFILTRWFSYFVVLLAAPKLAHAQVYTGPQDSRLVDELSLHFVTNGVSTTPEGRLFLVVSGVDGDTGPKVVEYNRTTNSSTAYPNQEWNSYAAGKDPATLFVNINSQRIGPDGHLYLVDTVTLGILAPTMEPCGPRLVQVDLSTNAVNKVYCMGNATSTTSFLDDVRFHPASGTAYLTDAGSRAGLIVLSMASGEVRRMLNNHPSTKQYLPVSAEGTTMRMNEKPVYVYADQLEVSPNAKYLYFEPASDGMRRIDTLHLDQAFYNSSLNTNEVLGSFVEVFAHTSSTGGIAIDADGNVYNSDTDSQRIIKIFPNGTMTTLIQDPRLLWVDAMWVNTSGKLWMPAAQLNRGIPFNNGTNLVREPVHVYTIDIGVGPSPIDHA